MKLRLAILAATIAVPAHAETPDAGAMRAAMAEYGQCIVKREPGRSRDFVLSGSFMSRRDQDEQALLGMECMPGEKLIRQAIGQKGGTVSRARLRLPDSVIRWAIAQSLFDRDAAKLAAADFSAIPVLKYEEPYPVRTTTEDGDPLPEKRIAEQQRRFEEKAGDVALAKLGECVARIDSAGTKAVLVTTIDTAEELSALKSVTPALSKCLPAGQTLKLDRMSLRGSLAVAFYRLANAVQSNGAAS